MAKENSLFELDAFQAKAKVFASLIQPPIYFLIAIFSANSASSRMPLSCSMKLLDTSLEKRALNISVMRN